VSAARLVLGQKDKSIESALLSRRLGGIAESAICAALGDPLAVYICRIRDRTRKVFLRAKRVTTSEIDNLLAKLHRHVDKKLGNAVW
jgi:hypothetical protein